MITIREGIDAQDFTNPKVQRTRSRLEMYKAKTFQNIFLEDTTLLNIHFSSSGADGMYQTAAVPVVD